MNIATAIPSSSCSWSQQDFPQRNREPGGWQRRAASLFGDQRTRVVVGVERTQIVEPLAYAHELHGEAELHRDGDRDPTFCASVELRERDARHSYRVAEEP